MSLFKSKKGSKPSFVSYVGDKQEVETQNDGSPSVRGTDNSDAEMASRSREPRLLPGEMMICFTEKVVKYIPYGEERSGIVGTLYVTNFKLTFVPAAGQTIYNGKGTQRNLLVGDNDIVLNNIDAVYQTSKSKRKKLSPGKTVSERVKNLQICCKDLSIHYFNFSNMEKDHAKPTVNAIVYHAFPKRLDLQFTLDYLGDTQDVSQPRVPWFGEVAHWENELERLKAPGYRVTNINHDHSQSESLPCYFVIPSTMPDNKVTEACKKCEKYRCPVWSYSHCSGTSLVRMPNIMNTCDNPERQEEIFLAYMRNSDPRHLIPKVIDLNDALVIPNQSDTPDERLTVPNVKDIRVSHDKIKEMTMPATLKDLHNADGAWLSALDGSRWLHHVGQCIKMATKISEDLTLSSVVVKERDGGTDLTPVICCLVQILLDPFCRTQHGFQVLVEREWVAMGHRFAERYGFVNIDDEEDNQSPVFLLFLDCVWQLQRQFISVFQFSEVYLISLWDSLCTGLFSNFLFNSPNERVRLTRRGPETHYQRRSPLHQASQKPPQYKPLLSVWDWSKQFTEDAQTLFRNPMYSFRIELEEGLLSPGTRLSDLSGGEGGKGGKLLDSIYRKKLSGYFVEDGLQGAPALDGPLRPVVSPAALAFWAHCYLRWLTPVQIIGGGSPAEYLQQSLLMEEVLHLQRKIDGLQSGRSSGGSTISHTSASSASSMLLAPEVPAPGADRGSPVSRSRSDLYFSVRRRPEGAPGDRLSHHLTSSFPYSPCRPANLMPFIATPIKMFMEQSLMSDADDGTGSELEESNGSYNGSFLV